MASKRIGGIFYENGSKMEVRKLEDGAVILILGREGKELKAQMRADQAKRVGEFLIKAGTHN